MSNLTRIEEKYLKVLNEIHSRCQQGGEFKMRDILAQHRVDSNLSRVLLREKLVINVGGNKFPYYQWKTIRPNIYMVKELIQKKKDLEFSKDNVKRKITRKNQPTTLTKEVVLSIVKMKDVKHYSFEQIAEKIKFSSSYVARIYKAYHGSSEHLNKLGQNVECIVNEAKQELNSTIVVPPRMFPNKVQENKPTMEHRVIEKPTQKSINILWGLINIKF